MHGGPTAISAMRAFGLFVFVGIVIVSLLTAIAFVVTLKPMQESLDASLERALAEAGQSWASVRVDGQTAVLSGTAPTPAAQRSAAEIAARLRGIRRVRDASDLLPLRAIYELSIRRDADAVTLDGSMPSDAVRDAVKGLLAATMPGVPLRDATTLARGQGEDFLDLVRFAVARAAELAVGTVTLTGSSLSIQGTARDEPSFEQAAAALTQGLPAAVSLRSVEILPPHTDHFIWRITSDGAQVTLSGYIPSAGMRSSMAAMLAKTMPGIAVVDQTKLASGAPLGLAAAAAFAAAALTHLEGGAAVIEDGRLSLSGKAKSVEDHQRLLADLAAWRAAGDDGLPIGTLDIVPPVVDPYIWNASRDARRIVLAGYVPSEAIRRTIGDAAAQIFAGLPIDDRLAIAVGDPKLDWVAALRFSLTQLALLSSGTVSLEGPRYTIKGQAASVDAFKTLTDALGQPLPAGMDLAGQDVAPATVSPFTLSIARTASGLTIGGFLSGDEATAALVALAKPRFPGAEIELRIARAGGMPDGFLDAAGAAIQAVSRLSGGRALLSGLTVALSGSAVSEDAKKAIEAALAAALPQGGALQSSVIAAVGGEPLSAAECQSAFNHAFEGGVILFADDGAVRPESLGFIDHLAAIAQRCPAARLEIGEHPGSGGSAESGGAKSDGAKSSDAKSDGAKSDGAKSGDAEPDQAGSETRTRSVLELLVADGVRRERLTALAFDEGTPPAASNAATDGRAGDNRIAITVRAD